MNRRKRRFYALSIILIFSLFFNDLLKAQSSCSQNLSLARNLFSNGRYYDVGNTLENCIKDGFNKQEKVEALRLMSLSYLYLDKYADADSAYLMLLKTSPEFRANPQSDPPDLVFLDQSFSHKPIFRWSVFAGLNQVFPRIIFEYNIFPNGKITRKPVSGVDFGVGLEKDLFDNLSLALDGHLQFCKYSSESKSDTSIEKTVFFTRNFTWARFPLYLKYKFGNKRFKPFISVGGSVDLLFASKYARISRSGGTEINVADITTNKNSSFFNYSLVASTGVILKTKNISSVAVDITYGFGLTNITNEKHRYDIYNNGSPELQQNIINFDLIPPAARLDQVVLTIRFIQPFYRPRKIVIK